MKNKFDQIADKLSPWVSVTAESALNHRRNLKKSAIDKLNALLNRSPLQTKTNDSPPGTILTYDADNVVYIPSHETISHKKDENIFYYDNLLYVSFHEAITEKQIAEIEDRTNGQVVGKINGIINALQLYVEAEGLNELLALAADLEKLEEVYFADYSSPLFITNLLSLFSTEIENFDYSSDWWVEAIHADRAWQYIDQYPDKFHGVNLAIWEIGNLDMSQEDIKNNLRVVLNDEKVNQSNHASIVTKLVASRGDSNNIRGIVSGLDEIKIEYRSIGGAIDNDYLIVKTTDANLMAMLNMYIRNNDKLIINNSWGVSLESEEVYNANSWISRLMGKAPYEDYVEGTKKAIEAETIKLIKELDKILSSGYDRFLIVQSAGNGFMRKNRKIRKDKEGKFKADAALTGYFANITERTYKFAQKETELRTSFTAMKEHIIIVGGAEKNTKNNRYYAPDLASYGKSIDIAAPSENLYIPTLEHTKERGVCGTSYAAPLVSSSATLIWSYNPDFSAREVKQCLINNSTAKVIETKGSIDSYPMLNATSFLNPKQKYRSLLNKLAGSSTVHFIDLNNDGAHELIVVRPSIDGGTTISEIYTLIEQRPIKIFESSRHKSYQLHLDGTIQEEKIIDNGTNLIQTSFYALQPDGSCQLKAVYLENKETGTFENLSISDAYFNRQLSRFDVYTLTREFGGVINLPHQ